LRGLRKSSQIAVQRNAEKRREEELSAFLCGFLRLGVKSSPPASKAGDTAKTAG